MCKWSAKVGAFTRFSDETAAPGGRLPEVWCATSMGQLSALRKGGYQKLENILLGKYKRQVRTEEDCVQGYSYDQLIGWVDLYLGISPGWWPIL